MIVAFDIYLVGGMFLIDNLRRAHPLEILMRLMFLGVAAILLGFAVWMAIDNLIVISTHEKATAEVLSSERIGPAVSKGSSSYYVRLRYELNGKARTVELGRSSTNYDVGELIIIYYDPETAYKAIAGDFWGMWFTVIVVALPGLIFLFYGVRPDKKNR